MILPVDYGSLSISERREVRREYVRQQDGKCYYCGAPLNADPRKDVLAKRVNQRLFPASFFKWPIHLHHDHKTGLTIGAVHNHCNAVLWQYHGE